MEWLDDSSCNLVFETEEAVQKVHIAWHGVWHRAVRSAVRLAVGRFRTGLYMKVCHTAAVEAVKAVSLQAIRELAVAGDGLDALRNSPWTRTGPLSVGSKDRSRAVVFG